jgi:DUF35 OB-fold domain, acyl-CoA-associated
MRAVTVDPPGILYSFTENRNAWGPDRPADYLLGLVEFPQYSGIRFVGFLEGYSGEPEIGSLVGFVLRPGPVGFHRPHFRPWCES